MFARALNWVANEFLVEKLANSPAFQRWAVRTDAKIASARTVAEQHAQTVRQQFAEGEAAATKKVAADGHAQMMKEKAMREAQTAQRKAEAEVRAAEKQAQSMMKEQEAKKATARANITENVADSSKVKTNTDWSKKKKRTWH